MARKKKRTYKKTLGRKVSRLERTLLAILPPLALAAGINSAGGSGSSVSTALMSGQGTQALTIASQNASNFESYKPALKTAAAIGGYLAIKAIIRAVR